MSYFELAIKVNTPSIEIISDFLISELGFSSVLTDEDFIHQEKTFDVIKAYAQEGDIEFDGSELQNKLLKKRLSLIECGFSEQDLGDWTCSFSKLEDESWADNWKKYWDIQKIGQKTVICPSWLEYSPAEDEIKIEIDPGSAFGTGTHPTTRLCILELEKYIKSDCTVADIGCGSGILAIVAKKLGAKEVMGVDIDSDSVRVSNENAKINAASCIFSEGTIQDVVEEYDVVVANILANVIVDIMSDLKRITKQSGILILSGIIEDKAQSVVDALKKVGLTLVAQEIQPGNGENWVCIVAKK